MKPRELAAQCWCDPETEMIEMDARLAEAFAKRLKDKDARIAELQKYIEDQSVDAGSLQRLVLEKDDRIKLLVGMANKLRGIFVESKDVDLYGIVMDALIEDDKMRGEG